MVPRRSSTAVLLGVVVSLVLHASILVPGLIKVMSGEVTPMRVLRADFAPEDFMTVEIEPDQVELGIDESTASTMTWIGFEDYQEHMAALAEVEQAAFQTTPTGSEPLSPPLRAGSMGIRVCEAVPPPQARCRSTEHQTTVPGAPHRIWISPRIPNPAWNGAVHSSA